MRDVTKTRSRFLSVMSKENLSGTQEELDKIYRINTIPFRNPHFFLVTRHWSQSKILLRPGADAIERFLDVLNRVGHAEAQITLAEIAKRGPG